LLKYLQAIIAGYFLFDKLFDQWLNSLSKCSLFKKYYIKRGGVMLKIIFGWILFLAGIAILAAVSHFRLYPEILASLGILVAIVGGCILEDALHGKSKEIPIEVAYRKDEVLENLVLPDSRVKKPKKPKMLLIKK
jgi:hypothetical protein